MGQSFAKWFIAELNKGIGFEGSVVAVLTSLISMGYKYARCFAGC
jgi:hypothetical protein